MDRGPVLSELKIAPRKYAAFVFLIWSCAFLLPFFGTVHDGHWNSVPNAPLWIALIASGIMLTGLLLAKYYAGRLHSSMTSHANGLYIDTLGFIPWDQVLEAKKAARSIGFRLDFKDSNFVQTLKHPFELKPGEKTIFSMNLFYPLFSTSMPLWRFFKQFAC